ncbi:hypothetical protein B0H17DRAFT_1199027 [Mycena rosella]|uniref:Uncharacterized protein n=1 Tax=Mycena rosella TaxID=1033263 RepID=A0AAD7DM30_MYCRO|nr:hypothetical protein B0H17DRAFT_1199027 [Mycena rosella]
MLQIVDVTFLTLAPAPHDLVPRCNVGDIFSVQEENETAIILFEVACSGFATMGVYQFHADCLRGMAEIHKKRQTREIQRLNAKVRDMEEYLMASGHTLATLAQLHAPVEAPPIPNHENEKFGETIGDDCKRSHPVRL